MKKEVVSVPGPKIRIRSSEEKDVHVEEFNTGNVIVDTFFEDKFF